MKLLIQLCSPTQQPDGSTYTAIFGEAEETELLGQAGAMIVGVLADVFVPLTNVASVAVAKTENLPEFGEHVLVID